MRVGVTHSIVLGLPIWMMLALFCGAQGDSNAINPGVPWPATDELGRSLPAADAGIDTLIFDTTNAVTYRDHLRETDPRDFDGAAELHYVNRSGLNDLAVCKVARDDRYLYWYVRTREEIQRPSAAPWICLLIGVDQNHETGWEGFDFSVNRKVENDHETWLERYEEDGEWHPVHPVSYRMAGNQLHLAVPRALLGWDNDRPVEVDFKWVDNLPQPFAAMDFYRRGDVAPEGRFKFRYNERVNR